MDRTFFQSSLGWLRIIAFLEGCSYLLFGVTMPLKYGLDIPEPNYFIGMAHGFLFIAYVGIVIFVGIDRKWSLSTLFWSLLASIIPFGTFVADKKIFKSAYEAAHEQEQALG
jgi:integral membrane protein